VSAPRAEAASGGALRRSLSLPWLVLYGLGTTVGGGVYALTGEIAGLAGTWSWLSWALACAVAAPTALSFGELASRYPRSAGEAALIVDSRAQRLVDMTVIIVIGPAIHRLRVALQPRF